jgi:hypothetical protein
MKRFKYLAFAVVAAGAAFAGVNEDAAGVAGSAAYVPPNAPNDGVGSVIQSWATPAGSEARGCCETGGRVIVTTYYNPQYVCTPAGSLVRSHSISLGTGWRDPSRCHLGAGYYAVINATLRKVVFVHRGNGTVAGSFAVSGTSPFPMNLTYDARANYYYANGYYNNSTARRYTTTGSFAGDILIGGFGAYCGGLGWTPRVKGVRGSYIWANNFGGVGEAVCTTTGSVVASWSAPERYGCGGDCGKHHAADARVVWELRGPSLRAYEVDLANNTAVAPASLGQVKALYR